MMTPEHLSAVYQQILARSLIDGQIKSEEGSTSLLLQTDWVRILLVHDFSDSPRVTLEVESYLPDLEKTAKGRPIGTHSSSEDYKVIMRDLVSSMIAHLNYLLRLCEYGFKLDFIGPEYLWTATYELEGIPSSKFFELLVPPS